MTICGAHHGNAAAACEALIKAAAAKWEAASPMMGSEKDDEGYRDDITATVLFFPFLPGQQDAEPLAPEKVPAADSGLARERRGSNESGSTGKRGPGIPAIARARRNSDQSETSDGSGTRNTSDPSKEASPAPGRNSLFAKRDKKRMTFGAEVVDVSRRSANETAALAKEASFKVDGELDVEMQRRPSGVMKKTSSFSRGADRDLSSAKKASFKLPDKDPQEAAMARELAAQLAEYQAKVEEAQRKGFEREDELSDGDLEGVHDDLDALNDELSLPPSQFNSNAPSRKNSLGRDQVPSAANHHAHAHIPFC